MKVSRRAFLAASGCAVLPWPILTARAAPPDEAYAIGELWGMPYIARGAQGLVILPRAARQGPPVRTFEYTS
jgi:hypothetical protein